MKRAEVLKSASECVCRNRESSYGSPEDNFQIIADLWTAYKGVKFSATEVAMMMILLKTARQKTGSGHDDNYVDIAGYAACAAEVAECIKK